MTLFPRPAPPGLFFPLCAPLSLAFCGFKPRVSWALAQCGPFPRPPLLVFVFPSRFSPRPAWFVVCYRPPLRCFGLLRAVQCSLARLFVCVLLCCRLLLRVVPCLWSFRPAVLFALWFAVWFWSALPCAVVCGVPGCCAVPRCCALFPRRCAVVCYVVLSCSFGAAACCPLPSCAARRPGVVCFQRLCFVVFPCAVCILSWYDPACCCSPLCFVLCLSSGVVLCVPCPLRSVRCCAALCWCAFVVLFMWSALFPAPGAVVRCCALLCFLWCSVVRCWVWLSGAFFWWCVYVPVALSSSMACFPLVSVGCCGALLPCAVFCGAVLLCCAVLSCCVVLCGAVYACFFLFPLKTAVKPLKICSPPFF